MAILFAVFWTLPLPIRACSCIVSTDWGFIGAESGQLPANAAGVAWFTPLALHKAGQGKVGQEIIIRVNVGSYGPALFNSDIPEPYRSGIG